MTTETAPPRATACLLALVRAATGQGHVVSRTKAIKLLYLADLRSVEKFGEPMSGVTWKWWHYGPYSTELREAEERLVREKLIDREFTHTSFGSQEVRFWPVTDRSPADVLGESVDKRFFDLISSVVDEFGGLAASTLVDVAYKSEPMRRAKDRGEKGVILDLEEERPVPSTESALHRLSVVLASLPTQETDDEAVEEIVSDLQRFAGLRRETTHRMIE